MCLFLLAFAFGEICFLSSLIPVVDRQCLALVRQCRKKKSCCVFGLCWCFGVVLFRHLEDIWLFAFHLFSYNLRIVDRPQDVLMTVRASSVHGMSKKKMKDGRNALQDFESVPRRWPLARLTVPLLKCVEHLDRVIAGCCWEVLITRKNPDESLGALPQAAKSLTIMLAGYMAEFVAETLRAVLTFQGAPLPMRKIFIFWVRTIGFSPSIKSCCMRHQGITRVCKEKGSDLAVGWSKLWLSRSTSEPVCLMTTRRVSLIGLEDSVQLIR